MGRNRWGLNKSQRMQLKAFICLLGVLLLLILLLGRLILIFIHSGREDLQKEHPPVVRRLANVWIMEVEESGLLVFQDGETVRYPYGQLTVTVQNEAGEEESVKQTFVPDISVREQLADLTLTDGAVTAVRAKTDKINGRILSADSEGIELEGYGRIPLARNYKGYRLYDSLEMCTVRDLRFGYNFADFCIENGAVCGVLMAKEEAMEYIRVLIKASDYSGLLHERVVLTCDTDFTVVYGDYGDLREERFPAGTELEIDMENERFVSDRIWITPDVLTGKLTLQNCGRSQGIPSYRGRMELLWTEDGMAVINEVLLEEYLYSVVPSEMPAKYPAEALKAQAICARTYAYGHMERAGYPRYGAHVDDSTSYQVYNNILEQESTTTAVKETYGQLLYTAEGTLAGTYYYSTSCGVGSDANVWKTETAPTLTYLRAKPINHVAMEQVAAAASGAVDGAELDNFGELLREESTFEAFITGKNQTDFEVQEAWYRWSYQVEELDLEHVQEVLQKRYDASPKQILTFDDEEGEYVSCEIGPLDDITDIYVEKRGSGGVADELIIETKTQRFKVIAEHNIRYVLNDGVSKIVRQDGSRIASPSILPSGFFVLTLGKEDGNVVGYTLTGGGFGHGVGMSQNGAKEMAKSGYSAENILRFFYEDCSLEKIYE